MPVSSEIQSLCAPLERGEIDTPEFLERLTRRMAAQFRCSRAGVRVFLSTPEGRILRSVALYDAVRDCMIGTADLLEADAQIYFAALLREGWLVAADARSHPALAPLLQNHLLPLDIRSVLDVAIPINGVPFGTFTCEQVGTPAAWTPRQRQLLHRMGTSASLSLMHAAARQIDTAPGALWEPSASHRLADIAAPLDRGVD